MTSLEALISAPPPNPLHGHLPSPQQAPRLRLASELWALCLVCTKDTSHRSSGGLGPPLHPTRRPGPALLHCPPAPGQPTQAQPLGPHMDAPTNC